MGCYRNHHPNAQTAADGRKYGCVVPLDTRVERSIGYHTDSRRISNHRCVQHRSKLNRTRRRGIHLEFNQNTMNIYLYEKDSGIDLAKKVWWRRKRVSYLVLHPGKRMLSLAICSHLRSLLPPSKRQFSHTQPKPKKCLLLDL